MAAIRGRHAGSGGATVAAVALVAPTRSAARRAAAVLAARTLGRARALPMTIAEYLDSCRARAPIPLVLAGDGSDPAADRRFLEAARRRLLWRRPAAEVYDAISGLRTDLPPRRRSPDRRRRGRARSRPAVLAAPAAYAEPYLLLEGIVTAARAARALASPVRNWVVENVGRVRIGERGLARLAARGVRWSVLWPVDLEAVVDPRAARKIVSRAASARRAR